MHQYYTWATVVIQSKYYMQWYYAKSNTKACILLNTINAAWQAITSFTVKVYLILLISILHQKRVYIDDALFQILVAQSININTSRPQNAIVEQLESQCFSNSFGLPPPFQLKKFSAPSPPPPHAQKNLSLHSSHIVVMRLLNWNFSNYLFKSTVLRFTVQTKKIQ